jgi:hypothetical protein
MVQTIQRKKIMAFLDIFKDDNEINEKAILGFASFGVLTIYGIADVVTGLEGQAFVIEPIILEVFAGLTFGCFGIASYEKVANRKTDAEREKNLPGGLAPLPEDEG